MMTDEVPASLSLYVGVDGGDTSRNRVERRSFGQNSLTRIETGRSQEAKERIYFPCLVHKRDFWRNTRIF
ncbi:MAG: hypothetical protein ACFFER_16675 [Candidatus Thorarchaeota archaeon]